MIRFNIDKLNIEIYPDRLSMGKSAANDVAFRILELLREKEEINILFAAAPSQNEFLETLVNNDKIEWSRINGFHMDEYIGLKLDDPRSFGNFLKNRIFGQVPFKNVYYIEGKAQDTVLECDRYAKLLSENTIDIACLGIGENGHIAFNDPHVANFNDQQVVKVVDLDMECRVQQVNDGCFEKLEDVPRQAYTLTIPMLVSADSMFCMVPGKTKKQSVKNTLYSSVGEHCPATILRYKDGAKLYLDEDSASLLDMESLIKMENRYNKT